MISANENINDIDMQFFKTVYIHELLELSNCNEKMINYYNANNHLYRSKNHFYKINKDFDWVYYSKYYQLDKFNLTDEYNVISFYLKHKNELNIINQNIALEKANGIFYMLDDKYKIISKKILFVTHELSLTGAPLLIYELCKIYGAENNIHIINLGQFSPSICLSTNIKVLSDRNIKFENYDIVVINTISRVTINYLKSMNYVYLPNTIIWVHEMQDNYYNYLEEFNFTFAIGLFDSEIIKDKFISTSPKMCLITKVHKLANLDMNLNALNKTVNNKMILGNFGTIAPHKNQLEIIKALEICIKKGYKNIILKLIKNTTNYYNEINNYINGSSISTELKENIQFINEIKQENIGDYYKDIDIYVSSSTKEPFGKTLTESMECKIPIIAYNEGSHKLLIRDKFNGMIYNNVDELASKIIYLHDNKNDMMDMGVNGYIYYKLNYACSNRYINEWNKIMLTICNNYQQKLLRLGTKISSDNANLYEIAESNSIIYNKKLFIFGGFVMKESFLHTVRIIDIESNEQKVINFDKTMACNHLCIAEHDNYAYIISGQYENGYGFATNKFYKFNLDNYEITYLINCPFKTYCSKSIMKDNKILVTCGAQNNRACGFNEIWSYCIINCVWEKVNENHYDAIHAGSIIYNNQLYIFGGNYDHAQCCYLKYNKITHETIYVPRDDIVKLNDNFELEKVGSMSMCKSHIDDAVCEYNGIIYIFGGQIIGDCVTNNISIFIPELGISFDIIISKIMDYVLKGCSVKIFDNKLLCFGGQYGDKVNNKAIVKFNNSMIIYNII